MVCVLDFKREVGLWHAVLASVFNGMRVVFVPYSLMKINTASWMLMATKLQGLSVFSCYIFLDTHFSQEFISKYQFALYFEQICCFTLSSSCSISQDIQS